MADEPPVGEPHARRDHLRRRDLEPALGEPLCDVSAHQARANANDPLALARATDGSRRRRSRSRATSPTRASRRCSTTSRSGPGSAGSRPRSRTTPRATSSRTTRGGRCACSSAARSTSRPTSRCYGRLQPRVDPEALERDVLAETCRAAAARGMRVDAWTIFLHADRPDEHQDCVTVNAFGDRYPADLCPAHPDVRAYVRALVADVCRYEIGSILAESLHYHPVEHGHEHERYLIELGTKARYLLGLCFCEHCLARAARAGVDGGRGAGGGARRARAGVREPRRRRDGRARAGHARGRRRRRARSRTSTCGPTP